MRLRTVTGLGVSGVLVLATLAFAQSANEEVSFPEAYRDGVHYATVTRGNIREEIFTSPEAVAAAREGRTFPDGTVIMMEDYRGDELPPVHHHGKNARNGPRFPRPARGFSANSPRTGHRTGARTARAARPVISRRRQTILCSRPGKCASIINDRPARTPFGQVALVPDQLERFSRTSFATGSAVNTLGQPV